MSWILMLVLFTKHDVTLVENMKFSTQYSCIEAGKMFNTDALKPGRDQYFKYACVKAWDRKHKDKKNG